MNELWVFGSHVRAEFDLVLLWSVILLVRLRFMIQSEATIFMSLILHGKYVITE
jgi:hypothetical protein